MYMINEAVVTPPAPAENDNHFSEAKAEHAPISGQHRFPSGVPRNGSISPRRRRNTHIFPASTASQAECPEMKAFL